MVQVTILTKTEFNSEQSSANMLVHTKLPKIFEVSEISGKCWSRLRNKYCCVFLQPLTQQSFMRESLFMVVFRNNRNVTRRSRFIVTINEKTLYLSLLPVWTLKDQDSIVLI